MLSSVFSLCNIVCSFDYSYFFFGGGRGRRNVCDFYCAFISRILFFLLILFCPSPHQSLLLVEFPVPVVKILNNVCLMHICGTWLLSKRRMIPLPKISMRPQTADFRGQLLYLKVRKWLVCVNLYVNTLLISIFKYVNTLPEYQYLSCALLAIL